MEMKKYIAPSTDTIDISVYGNLLDWVIGSPIGEGSGDVDAKAFVFFEEVEEDELDMEMYNHLDVWH